jgi:hypothetical protein
VRKAKSTVSAAEKVVGQLFVEVNKAFQLTQQENSGEVLRLACLSVAPPLKLCLLRVIDFFMFLSLLPHYQTQKIAHIAGISINM